MVRLIALNYCFSLSLNETEEIEVTEQNFYFLAISNDAFIDPKTHNDGKNNNE